LYHGADARDEAAARRPIAIGRFPRHLIAVALVPIKQALIAAARRWFLPQRPGAAPSPQQREAMQFYVAAGEARARCAPSDAEDEMAPVSAGLLRDAVLCFLRGLHHARHAELELGADVPPEALRALLDEPGLLPASDSRQALVGAALGATDALAFDRMPLAEVTRLRQALDELVTKLRARIDLRTDLHFRVVGAARIAVVALVVAYGLASLAGHLFRGENVARGRPVKVSSQHPGTPDPSGLVDGVVGGTYGAHTLVGGPVPPWIVVDLQRTRHIRKIVVYNRGDVNLDQSLPYSLFVSQDGVSFTPLAKRTNHFGSGDFLSSPWTVRCDVRARYVRVEANGYIALSELEVYE
jgi:hypothetical protein